MALSTSLVIVLLVFGLAMCLWVYCANPNQRENRGFPLMVLAILSWVVFYHLAQLDRPTFWFRLSACSVFLFFVAYYFFVVEWFLGKRGRAFRALGTAVLVYGFVIGALSLTTDLVIASSMRVGSVARPVFHQTGRWAFYGFVTVVTLFINWMLVKEYLEYPKERRFQVQYFLAGLLLFAGLNIVFNVLLPVAFDVYQYYWVGNYSVVFLLAFTAYAIVKRELFGIRTVLTTLLVVAIALLLGIDLVAFTQPGALQLLKGGTLLLFLYFGYMLVRSVHREIAQRKKLEEIAEELRRSDESKTEFLSIVAHQLRTPLNAISGYLMLLLEGAYGELDPEKRWPVERLHRSTQRLIHLVQDLLSVSRLQMGRIDLELGEVDVCRLVTSVAEEFSLTAEEKGIRLEAACPEQGVPVIRGDAQKLRDSILNLVDNAIRYTEEGSVRVSVEVQGADVVVRVADTGPGIEPAQMRALFESFQRGEVGRRQWAEGTGLGLYIARQFVTLHGGKIWVESAGKGWGSTFCIRLPSRRGRLAA